jgi:hypothetical protein
VPKTPTVELHDPLVRRFRFLFDAMRSELATLDSQRTRVFDPKIITHGGRHTGSLMPLRIAMTDFLNESVNAEEAFGTLPHLLTTFEEARKLFLACDAVLAACVLQDSSPHSITSALRWSLDRDFRELAALVKAVTPAQLTLQAHFTRLVQADMIVELDAREGAFFGPLATLRDKYFEAPRPGLLTKYLETADGVANSDKYQEYLSFVGRKTVRTKDQRVAEVAELATELEVMSMLEPLDCSKELK